MPALGFGSSVGSRLPDLANFPSDGLVALYKCDELEGAVLNDAAGRLPSVALATGVAMDCTTNAQYFTDTTGLTTALNGQPVEFGWAAELYTGALTSTNAYDYLLSNASAGDAPIEIALRETAYGGENRWRLYINLQCAKDGGAAAQRAFTLPTTFHGLKANTYYQIAFRLYTGTATPYAVVAIRSSISSAWITGIATTAETAAATGYTFSSNVAHQVLSTVSAASPFTGKIISMLVAHGDVNIEDLKNAINRPSQTFIESALGDVSRFWDFRGSDLGAGTKITERITGTMETVTGTNTWVSDLTGCTQTATRQGMAYYGKAGIRIGGETSFLVPGDGGVSASSEAPILASADGWTMIATLRVGTRDPAAEQFLCGFYGPNDSGTVETDLTKLHGAFITFGTDQMIKFRLKRMAAGTDTGTGVVGDIGKGGNYASNGLLTTYAISCSAAGAVTLRRIAINETSLTTTADIVTANAGNVVTRANAVKFGMASFDADLVVGFLGAYNRPLTDAEVMQCHKMSVARMRGQDIFVNGDTGYLGNGTENTPYSTIATAWRTLQPSTTVRVNGGTFARLTNLGVASSPAIPSSSDHITLIGTNAPELVSTATTAASYPGELVSGHFTWSGFVFDALDAANNITTPAAVDGYSTAFNASEDVDYVKFTSCTFKNAYKSEESNGTGFACRAKTCIITDCTSTGNEEHGVYLRRWVGETEDGAVTVDGLTVTNCGEDGLKITAEGGGGTLWRGSIRNLKVTGGDKQLNLLGFVGDVANVLLTGQDNSAAGLAACYLGNDPAYTGETLDSDFRFEGRVTNMTIVDAEARAVWVKGSNTTAALYNILTNGTNGVDLEVDADSTCTTSHCAGDSATGEWPDENGNIPGATITFVGATYVLDPESDGYGDGVNMTGIIEEAESTLAGVDRPPTGAWNIGAY